MRGDGHLGHSPDGEHFFGASSNRSRWVSKLVKLFEQWREFENPVMKNHLPDYSASAMAAKAAAFPQWRKRLDAIDPKSWPIQQQNDYKLVKAEISGLDFNLRVLRPWARDPAFYVNVFSSRSDVPWREGPVPYPEIELCSCRSIWPVSLDCRPLIRDRFRF